MLKKEDIVSQIDARMQGEIDYMVKAHGFASTGGVYVSSTQRGVREIGDQVRDLWGYHVQASYVINDWIQPLVRYAYVAPKRKNNDIQEAVAGITLYAFGHSLKWSAELASLYDQEGTPDETFYRFQTQAQLAF